MMVTCTCDTTTGRAGCPMHSPAPFGVVTFTPPPSGWLPTSTFTCPGPWCPCEKCRAGIISCWIIGDTLRAGLLAALKPFAEFQAKLDAHPFPGGLDPEVMYGIHGGKHVAGGADIHWAHIRAAAELYAKLAKAEGGE